MEPEKTYGDPVFRVEVDGQQSEPVRLSPADIFDLDQQETGIEDIKELTTIIDKTEEETLTVEWKMKMSEKNIRKSARIMRKRKKLIAKLGKLEMKWLALFQLAGIEGGEKEEDENVSSEV